MTDPHTIRIADEEWDQLQQEAESIGLSRSEYVRRILSNRDDPEAYSEANTENTNTENTGTEYTPEREYDGEHDRIRAGEPSRVDELEDRLADLEARVSDLEPVSDEAIADAVAGMEWSVELERTDHREEAIVDVLTTIRDRGELEMQDMRDIAGDIGLGEKSTNKLLRQIKQFEWINHGGQGGKVYYWSRN